MIPHYPLPYRKEDNVHNTVVKEYVELFVDTVSNMAEVTYGDYVDKKGKLNEHYPLRYKWIPTDHIVTGKPDRKSTRLNSSHSAKSRMPSSA